MAEGAGLIDPGGEDAAALEARYAAALARVPFRAGIYLPTDRVPLARKAAGMERVAELHNGPLRTVHAEQLRALRHKHLGTRRAFIIGNGPSLNRTDLSQLRNEVTFCVNGFFLKMPELDWVPTYYVVEDHLVAEDRAAAINALRGPTRLFPSYLGYCLDPGPDTIFFNHRARERFPHGFDFSTDAADVTYTGCTVTFTCMQLAHYMGFQELYLIGVDASYDIPKDVEVDARQGSTAVLDMASNDPNHFHPDYFGKGMRWHDPQVDKMLEAYAEARRVTDALGRPIYNATIGGALEVFERRAYSRLFPAAIPPDIVASVNAADTAEARRAMQAEAAAAAEADARARYPRILLLDVVPPGQMTATGELKSTLFATWPEDRLMQVAMDGHRTVVLGGGLTTGASAHAAFTDERIASLVDEFAPELIVFRPVEDRDAHTRLALGLVERLDAPIALWIVDDWPAHLARHDPAQWARLGPAFLALVQRAAVRLAISDSMSRAFEARYGQPFETFSNAVDPDDWPALPAARPDAGPFRIRYSGGLSPRMSLQSALELAEAVEQVPAGGDIVLEINTRAHWARQYANRFAGFRRTRLSSETMAPDAYRRWLQGGDMTAILYNFDAASIDYVRHSMANKTVECLASGAPPLVYGPRSIHTVDYLAGHDLGLHVTEPGVAGLVEALGRVVADRPGVRAMGEAARSFVFRERLLVDEQERLRGVLAGAAGFRTPPGEQETVKRLNADERAARLAADSRPGPASGPAGRTRLARMAWFYTGWRGALAAAATALPGLAFLLHALLNGAPSLPGSLVAAAATGVLAVVFFFIAYLFSLIEDYSPGGRPPG